jgi:hypothetical protein
MVKPSTYRGLYLVGDKIAGRITHVQVIDHSGTAISLQLHEYVARRIEPTYKTLPWRDDIKIKWAKPKP